jgi:hypothetical protein
MFLSWLVLLSASIIAGMTQWVLAEHVFLEMTAVNVVYLQCDTNAICIFDRSGIWRHLTHEPSLNSHPINCKVINHLSQLFSKTVPMNALKILTLNQNKKENCFLITHKRFPQNKHPNTGCKPSVYKHDAMNSFLDNLCLWSYTLKDFGVKSISFLCTTALQFGLSEFNVLPIFTQNKRCL